MSAMHRSYLTVGVFGILASAIFGALSPPMALLAGIALLTAFAVFSVIRHSGTPAPPMRQILYDMDVHEPRARKGARVNTR